MTKMDERMIMILSMMIMMDERMIVFEARMTVIEQRMCMIEAIMHIFEKKTIFAVKMTVLAFPLTNWKASPTYSLVRKRQGITVYVLR